ncbi:Putative RNA polymerase II subunit B1 CTD phosphatase RPAP2-like protein [Frankliniella fusca]|uniref:RNA polymerase II subunit B1 CTD phosphatase RPAP2 homolog n=1 Tax=Frankliniella fusca TaxID=407009 RepID=A0AAE1LHV7_9NEOP|nr:Putative RNA polymerase II subunit B1 CTD phosphatase RPAP2-like protein [Frankliniella fusca]
MESTSSSARRTPKSPRRGKGFPRRAQDLSKEELLLTLQKKRECNAKALKIVEEMLEPTVNEEWFLTVLQLINQSHLQDVTEERAIINLCGYPLCSNVLKNVPSQQYRISTRLNKVYDIKERKNFCSNKCFKSCKFIKDQMHTSPLWLRDIEPNIRFILMPSTETGGGVGDEINVQIERVTKEEIKKLSGEERNNSSSRKPDEESPLVHALNNLHVVADMRENDPLQIVEGLNSTDTKQENNLEQNSDQNSTTLVEDDKLLDMTFANIGSNIFVKKDANKSSKIQDLPSISLKGEKSKVSSCNTQEEIVSKDLSCEDNVTKDKGSGFVLISDAALCASSGALSIPKSMSSPAPCSLTDVDDSRPESTPNKAHSADGVCTEKVEDLNKNTAVEDRSPFSQIKSEYSTNENCSSSSTMCPQSSTIFKEKSEETVTDCKGLHQEETGSTTRHSRQSCSIKKRKEKIQKKQASTSLKSLPFVAHVEKCVQEWFTMETMCFLFGESALKEMLENKGECIQQHYKALNSITWDQEKHERFLAICKRLRLFEMEDSNFDSQVMKSEGDSKLKPLPNYEVLKREAESMELKVNAFFKGKLEINERKVSFAEDVKTDSQEPEFSIEPQIPLVHLHSQRALRKRIVLDGLNRVLPDILRTFGMRPSELTSSVRGLVGTFALTATNITFKPQEWSLLGLIVVKLLALRETELSQRLQQEQSKTYLTLMLMSYQQEPGYLDILLSWLTDIDRLLAHPQSSEKM